MDSIEAATEFFIKRYTKDEGRFIEYVENQLGKYCSIIDLPIIMGFGVPLTKRYYLLYKRKWENHFGQIYDKPEQVGQAITPDALTSAAMDGAWIVCVMIDHTIWECAAVEWLRYVNINKTIKPRIWKEKGITYEEASIPKRMLRRIM